MTTTRPPTTMPALSPPRPRLRHDPGPESDHSPDPEIGALGRRCPVADGSPNPGTGTRLIWADIAYGLGHPDEPASLVSCAVSLDD